MLLLCKIKYNPLSVRRLAKLRDFMKKERTAFVFALAGVLLCAVLMCGCNGREEPHDEPPPVGNTVTVNVCSQDGAQILKSAEVDFTSTYFCEFLLENADFYSESSGLFTEPDGAGVKVYDYYGIFTPEFIAFCEGKESVNVYEYKVCKTYELVLKNGTGEERRIHNVSDSFDLPEVDRRGYVFKGWSAMESGGGERMYVNGGDYKEDVVLYAIFSPVSFRIMYSVDPRNPSYCGSIKTATYGQKFTLDAPSETGFVFHGFYTEPDGKGDKICSESGESYMAVNFLPPDGQDYYLYAYFTEALVQKLIYDNIGIDTSVTVRYKGYYADGGELVATYNDGETVENKRPQPRAGYYFAGWYTNGGHTKYNFAQKRQSAHLILTAKFEKTEYDLFSGVTADGLTMGSLGYGSNNAHSYTYVYDCEDATVQFSYGFSVGDTQCRAVLTVTVGGSLVYRNETAAGERASGSFNAVRGDKITITAYVTKNSSGGTIDFAAGNEGTATSSVRVVMPFEFSVLVTEGSHFTLEYGEVEGKTFKGYYTGENGTGTRLTDSEGKSLAPWEARENNHYYKPYDDSVPDEEDCGVKIYAFYV